MIRVYIGIGSNLSDPVSQVQAAIEMLDSIEQSQFIRASSFYRSAPMGPQAQPDYVNAVACLDTALAAEDLLDRLQQIEKRQGRTTGQRWGPRTLDLDILLYGEQIISSARLSVPHPGLHERSFVLYPLQEIAPELDVPDKGQVADLVVKCSRTGLERIDLT